ncbi:MAG: hypothetical protein AB7P12_12200 [Alphaproteobacteria bacterium]
MTAIPNDNPRLSEKRRIRSRILVGAGIIAGLLMVIAANVHLVYVAMSSQPDCVEHIRAAGDAPGTFRAARPSC